MEQWIEQVWNQRDTEFIRSHLADPCPIHGMSQTSPFSVDDFIAFQQKMLGLIDDMRVEVIESMEEGERTIGIARVTGASNGRPIDFTFGYSATVRDDKIVEARNAVDFLTFLVQRGSIDEAAVQEALG